MDLLYRLVLEVFLLPGRRGRVLEAGCYGELPSHARGLALDPHRQRAVCWDTNSTGCCTIPGAHEAHFLLSSASTVIY